MPKILGGRRGREFALIVFALLGQATAAGAAAFAVRDLFSSLAARQGFTDFTPFLVLGLSGLAIAILRVFSRIVGERMGQSYAYDIRCEIYRHTSRMARQTVANRRSGAISLRFVGDLTALRSWVGLGMPQLVAAAILIPVTLLVLYLIEPEFGLYTLPLFILAVAIMAVFGSKLPEANRYLRSARWRLAADMTERMPNAPYFESIGRTRYEMDLIKKRTDTLIDASMERLKSTEYVRAVPEIISAIAAAMIIWLGFRAQLPTGSVAGALATLGLGVQPLRDLGMVWNRHSAWAAAHEKCIRALSQETLPARQGTSGALPKKLPSVSVAYLHISDSAETLVEAPAGSKIAITGASDTDKTAWLAGLAGLNPDMAQRIEINGTGLGEFSAKQRSSLITFITADDPLLKGSLRRVLTLGLPKRPSDRKIIRTAERIGLGPVLERLGGLDGKVSEGGRNLASGERICCLAVRAMLSRAPLVLLDGLVEMLDTDSQAVFFRWMRKSQATVFFTSRSHVEQTEIDATWDFTSRVAGIRV
jgi:ATP-binding cassette subfamily B protein/ATP-binding cassette subfamily C protein CydC